MTALLAASRAVLPSSLGAPRLFAGLDADHRALDLAGHVAVHGPLPSADLPRLVGLLDAVGLSGRGGAGFPLAAKLRALSAPARRVVVNGSESEPASAKDRALMRHVPHLVLDGALAVAAAVGARRVTVAVHDEWAATALTRATGERVDTRTVRVHRTGDTFVSGEARTLVRELTGGPALPPGRRVHATERGILLANAETFAQLAVLLRLGPRRFAATGTPDEPGTALLSVGGAVAHPGVLEVPLGMPLGLVLRHVGAEPSDTVVLGGYHGAWLPTDPALPLSRRGVDAAGGSFGAGVVLVAGSQTCALGELARTADWLAAQSAGQCGPCRFGLPALAADVRALLRGHPAALPAAQRHAALVDGRGACSHPDAAARYVRSGLAVLGDELNAHRRGGCGRPVLGVLPIGRTS